ncbi:hypothetical protein B0H19DRAFT_1383830 [Mycena capillaripes]|nr:hypothetical protein B0H19DRAFT_1383830 [Mycena capillaripes]
MALTTPGPWLQQERALQDLICPQTNPDGLSLTYELPYPSENNVDCAYGVVCTYRLDGSLRAGSPSCPSLSSPKSFSQTTIPNSAPAPFDCAPRVNDLDLGFQEPVDASLVICAYADGSICTYGEGGSYLFKMGSLNCSKSIASDSSGSSGKPIQGTPTDNNDGQTTNSAGNDAPNQVISNSQPTSRSSMHIRSSSSAVSTFISNSPSAFLSSYSAFSFNSTSTAFSAGVSQSEAHISSFNSTSTAFSTGVSQSETHIGRRKSLSTGPIVGITLGIVSAICLAISLLIVWCRRVQRRERAKSDLIRPKYFTTFTSGRRLAPAPFLGDKNPKPNARDQSFAGSNSSVDPNQSSSGASPEALLQASDLHVEAGMEAVDDAGIRIPGLVQQNDALRARLRVLEHELQVSLGSEESTAPPDYVERS